MGRIKGPSFGTFSMPLPFQARKKARWKNFGKNISKYYKGLLFLGVCFFPPKISHGRLNVCILVRFLFQMNFAGEKSKKDHSSKHWAPIPRRFRKKNIFTAFTFFERHHPVSTFSWKNDPFFASNLNLAWEGLQEA